MSKQHERIHLSLAHMCGREQIYIEDAFRTRWITPLGPNVARFEEQLAIYNDIQESRRVVALNSGTAAIHLGLVQLGVGTGDTVLCSSFTFSASANPIVYQGAEPIFVDSEPDTWNLSPHLLREAIADTLKRRNKLPKALIVVHLYGMPAAMDEICAIANEYQIPILEDAAEALGARYKGRPCGTIGRYGVFSFNGNKIITTSGGGALICPDAAAGTQALKLATQARDDAPHYQHSSIGYNYRLSNVCAGIGCGQMEVLDDYLAHRKLVHSWYVRYLSAFSSIKVQEAPSAAYDSNYWLTCIVLSDGIDREALRLWLEACNIESRPVWKPLHLQPVFVHCDRCVDGTSERIFDHGLCLPSGRGLTQEDVEYVCEQIGAFLNS